MPEAKWIEARRGKALVADPAKESLDFATISGPFASFAFSDAVCVETGNRPRFEPADLGEGDVVGEGDDD